MNPGFFSICNRVGLPGFLLALGALVGCTVGPDYREPTMQTPGAFGEAGQPTRPLPDTWWALLDDPILQSLIKAAAESNLDLRIAAARLDEARAGLRAAGADQLPSLAASASAARVRQSENSPFIPSLPRGSGGIPVESDLYRSGLDASWEIDLFGGTRRRTEAARARFEAAGAGLEEARRVILAEVALNYAELRGIQHQQRVIERNIDIQAQTLRFVENRLQAGLGSELDVAQARTQLESTRASLPELEAAARGRMIAIATLLGESPRARFDSLESYRPLPELPEKLLADLPSAVLRRRPDIRRAERELAAETADIGAAVGDLFPKFSLTGGAGLESGGANSFFDAASRTWSIGPGLQWAIFQGGAIRADIRAQEAQADRALAAYEQTVLRALAEVDTALIQHTRDRRTTEQLQRALNEAEKTVSLSKVLYEEGLTNFLSVLDAESRQVAIDEQLARSQTQEWTSLLRLYKALGGGWEMEGQ